MNNDGNNKNNNNDTFDSLLDIIHQKREDEKKNAKAVQRDSLMSDNDRTKIGADIVRIEDKNPTTIQKAN